MILFALAFLVSSLNEDPVHICFYDENETDCPHNSYKYTVSNFSEFIEADIPTSDLIIFEFRALTILEDVINISRFNESLLNLMEFNYISNETQSKPEFILSTSNNIVPPSLKFTNVKPTFDFNTNFSELLIENSPIVIPDRCITASSLIVDSNSLTNVDIITSDKIDFNGIISTRKQLSFKIKSITSNSNIDFISFDSFLKVSIALSNLVFENVNNESLTSFDLSEWYGNATVHHDSFSRLFTNVECLAYSTNHHFPFLIIIFANQLDLHQSNWPTSDVPLIQIRATPTISPFSNVIALSGHIPAHIYTGTSDLTITPTFSSTGFQRLTVQNKNLTIAQTFLFTEYYYLSIDEIETTLMTGNTTIDSSPPLLYVSIDKFIPNPSSKSEFCFIGTANYILKNLPLPSEGFTPTVYVEHLWFENNVTFEFNLRDGAPNIRVLDFVLMKTWPTYFIPIYNGKDSIEKVADDQKRFKLICAKLLKEQKEKLMLPPSGFPRGFNRGATIVHSHYGQDPTANQTLKCFELDIHGEVTDVSNIFCLANEATKSQCPSESQFIGESDSWQKFVETDAGELTFYAFRDSSLTFTGFSMVNVSVIGSKGTEKVDILPDNVDHLRLTNVDANLLADNGLVNVELTNSKLATLNGNYKMGPLTTDPASLKSIEGRDKFEVQVTVKNVPDTKITVTTDGSVTLADSSVTFKSKRPERAGDEESPDPSSLILINADVSSIVFSFEQGSGESIANNTIVAKFSNSSTASFEGLSHSSRFFVLDGFSGTLDFGAEASIPIDLINVHDVEIKSSQKVGKLTFESELDLEGSFTSDVEIRSNRVRVVPGARTIEDTSISADHFAVLDDSFASLKSLSVKSSLAVFPGSHLSIQNTEELPSVLTVNYKLENLPSISIGANTKTAETATKYKVSKIVFNYDDQNFNNAIMNRTLLFKDGIEIVSGSLLDCSAATYEFYSPYVYYFGVYSLLMANCVGDDHNAVKLFINPYSAVPPTASPAPMIPTQTPAPNNTKEQVIIISMTVVTFFLIIVIVIIKCMNRKKKYVSKNKNQSLDTQPMLIPNEGNEE